MENVRKHRYIKVVKTDRSSYLVSESNYHISKWFLENFLPMDKNKTKVTMNKAVHLYLSILNISKIAMYEYRYDFLKPKYGGNVKLCYTDTTASLFMYNQVIYMKTF